MLARIKYLPSLLFAAFLLPGLLGETAGALESHELGVIVNTRDPQSVTVADYYMEQRQLPASNRIEVAFPVAGASLDPEHFEAIYEQIRQQTPDRIQAYAVSWTVPNRVGCVSMTTALAAGYHDIFCTAGCSATAPGPLYDSATRAPFDASGWRPAMMLAGESVEEVKALIDRGIRADYSHPEGTAYLLSTSDASRSTRSIHFAGTQASLGSRYRIAVLHQDLIENQTDVMFYFTGLKDVPGIRTLTYLPGAIADHLTSSGGRLTDSPQMSALRWLEAGATGSYGTVSEPCNFPQKFPHPEIVMRNYLAGETLLESYWKSVAWPGQGLFIGEPLARPFAERSRLP